MRKKFSGGGGGELSRKQLILGEFVRIPVKNSFYLSYFLFADSILNTKVSWGIVRRKFLSDCWNCLEYLSVGVFCRSEFVHRKFFAG